MNKLKLVLAFLMAQTLAISAYAVEFSAGVTGHAGLYSASGHEKIGSGEKNGSENAVAEFTYASIFAEAKFDRFVIGGHFIPDTVETDTASEQRVDMRTDGSTATSTGTNSAKVEFTSMATAYAAVYLTDNAYFKLGVSSMDIETKESLSTGSTYPDTSVDGTEVGFGYNLPLTDNAFVRLEGVYVEYDGVTISSTANSNKVTLKGIDGVEGRASLGFTF